MVALLSVTLIGMGAFVVDIGYAYAQKRALSTAVDAAALAAANSLSQLPGTCQEIRAAGGAAAEAVATSYISGSKSTMAQAQVVPNSFTIDCSQSQSYAEITLDATTSTPTFLGGVFGAAGGSVTRSATARMGTLANPSGLRPYAMCATDALDLRTAFSDSDPDNDVVLVTLPNPGGGNNSILPRLAPRAADTTTTFSFSPASGITTATDVTLTATVTESNPPRKAASGAVEFRDASANDAVLGSASLNAAGQANLVVKLAAGTRSVYAVFIAVANKYNESRSAPPTAIQVAGAPATTPPVTTAPPTTAPPTTSEPTITIGPCESNPGNFGEVDYSELTGTDACEARLPKLNKQDLFACYIAEGYDQPLTLPIDLSGDTGDDCPAPCREAWVKLQDRQITLPVYNATEVGPPLTYTAPYAIGVRVCGYFFGSGGGNTAQSWISSECGKPWDSWEPQQPEPKGQDVAFQFAFTRLLSVGTINDNGCHLGADDGCDLLRGIALAPGPGNKS